jgi:hypothetical protein
MKEEWLKSNAPKKMLSYLKRRKRLMAKSRKLQLFACGCCRQIWQLLKDKRSRRAVEITEQFVDKRTTAGEHSVAANAAWDAFHATSTHAEEQGARTNARHAINYEDYAMAFACGAAHAATAPGGFVQAAARAVGAVEWMSGADGNYSASTCSHEQAALLRDIFHNPFQPMPTIDPAWLAWNGGTIPKLAQAIYDGHAFDRMPILADALEEAGCDNEEMLGHCRGSGLHVKGCWLLDLLRGNKD